MSSNPSEPKSFYKLDSLAAQGASPHAPVVDEATKAKVKGQLCVTPKEGPANRTIVKTKKGEKYSSKFHDPVPPHLLNPGPWPVPLRNPRGRLKNIPKVVPFTILPADDSVLSESDTEDDWEEKAAKLKSDTEKSPSDTECQTDTPASDQSQSKNKAQNSKVVESSASGRSEADAEEVTGESDVAEDGQSEGRAN